MRRIAIIDTTGDSDESLSSSFKAAGWEARIVADRAELSAAEVPPDAIVLIAGAGAVGEALSDVQKLRREGKPAVVLIADLDRSGWDRTFSTPEALDVDALFDLPADPAAVARRLGAILDAAEPPPAGAGTEMAPVIERAIANEEAAEAFYRRAAEAVTEPETTDILESLARDEQEHKHLLLEFKAGKRPLPQGHTQPAELAQSLATPDITPDLSPADAFLLAARKERLAVQFYESWAALYPEGPERDLLTRLAEVERRHQARVEGMFAEAAFPENF